MARRLIAYDDIALQNGTNISGPSTLPSQASTSSISKETTNGKNRDHWTSEGRPVTASAARKFRKVLQLLGAGKIEDANEMLKRLQPAQKSIEIQEALAWAMKKRSQEKENPLQINGQRFGKDESGGKGDHEGSVENQEEQEEEEAQQDHAETNPMGTQITWQGTNGSSKGKKGSAKEKALSHAEIWDDSALIDAWDAAMEEYKQFDEMRKAHQNKRKGKRGREEESEEEEEEEEEEAVRSTDTPTNTSKRSSLWHDSPDVGSEAALQAKEAAQMAKENAKELLIRKKREAKELLQQMMPEEEDHVEEEDDAYSVEALSDEDATSPLKDLRADETGKETLEAGSSMPNRSTGSFNQTHLAYNDDVAPATQTMSHEDVLQNLAMSWYYAGYYQAMAIQMSNQQHS